MMNSELNALGVGNNDLNHKIETIPDKMGFKIGEVAEYVGVKQYVLRYWETEFEALHPRKSENGQRFYTRKDIEMALIIRKLLHEDRFSIEGARAVLKKLRQQGKSQMTSAPAQETVTIQQPTTVIIQAPPVDEPARGADVRQIQKAIAQREREMNMHWNSSISYLIEEVREARKRLMSS